MLDGSDADGSCGRRFRVPRVQEHVGSGVAVTDAEFYAWLLAPLPLADQLSIEITEGRYRDELAAYEADLAACAVVRADLCRPRPSQVELAGRRLDEVGSVRARAQERRIAAAMAQLPAGYPALGDEVPEPTRLAG